MVKFGDWLARLGVCGAAFALFLWLVFGARGLGMTVLLAVSLVFCGVYVALNLGWWSQGREHRNGRDVLLACAIPLFSLGVCVALLFQNA